MFHTIWYKVWVSLSCIISAWKNLNVTYVKLTLDKSLTWRHVGTVHEEKKQFECKVCNSKFTQKANLNRHVTIVHKGSKQFKCEVCNTKFGEKAYLNKQVARVH